MTKQSINNLKLLRTYSMFENLTLEQLLYECLKANDWDKEELVYLIDGLIKEKESLLLMDK